MNDDLPRHLSRTLEGALRSHPVVVVTGARQTGKSTLARMAGARAPRRELTLDDLDVLTRARDEPDALLRGATPLTIDEVQRAPDLLLAVKRAVDRKRTPGRFLLTGSANLLLMRGVSESLAGRAVHLALWPLTRRERLGLGTAGRWDLLFETRPDDWDDVLRADDAPDEDWKAAARCGGFPEPAVHMTDRDARARWFAGYEQTYLERDLRDLSQVASLVDFRRLVRALALRIGSVANQSDLGRDVGLSQPTVHRHMNLLEVSWMLVRLPAYAVNRTLRLVKSPKVYWSDTGLAMHLAGESEPRGAHLENLVLTDLLAWRDATPSPPQVMHWRTTAGAEVDFVVERGDRLLPIEVKATARPRPDDARGIRAFRKEYGAASLPGIVLHTGRETSWLTDDVLAVPWCRVV